MYKYVKAYQHKNDLSGEIARHIANKLDNMVIKVENRVLDQIVESEMDYFISGSPLIEATEIKMIFMEHYEEINALHCENDSVSGDIMEYFTLFALSEVAFSLYNQWSTK